VYSVREFVPTSNNPVLRMNVIKVVLKVSDVIGHDFFAVDFFFSFKLSLLNTFLSQDGDTINKREHTPEPPKHSISPRTLSGTRSESPSPTTTPPATTATTTAAAAAAAVTTAAAPHWSQVNKQQLPTESSMVIRFLIEKDDANPENDLVKLFSKLFIYLFIYYFLLFYFYFLYPSVHSCSPYSIRPEVKRRQRAILSRS
jgi:hypothetical protein